MWARWISWAEFWYNTSPHTSIKITLFQALHGRAPPHLLRLEVGQTLVGTLEENLQEKDAMLDEFRFHLLRTQQIMKAYADYHRREV